ncbi:MAG: Sua5/YciO/YrdC/YwlC family protein, partial [bacterium]
MFLLLADATNEYAISKLRNLKKTFKPIPILIKNLEQLANFLDFNIPNEIVKEYLNTNKFILSIEIKELKNNKNINLA